MIWISECSIQCTSIFYIHFCDSQHILPLRAISGSVYCKHAHFSTSFLIICFVYYQAMLHCNIVKINWITIIQTELTLFQDSNGLFHNKANLRDLIAATGLVILLKLDSNCRFFSPCDLKIWWTTPKNNSAPLPCYLKLFASFRGHWWIQTRVTFRKRLIWVKIDDFFYPCDLEIWRMTFKNNRAPLLFYFKFCVAFRSHWWIQTGVTVRKRPIWVKIDHFLSRVTLKFDGWPWKAIGHLS